MTNKTKLTLILISLLAAGQSWSACSVGGSLASNPCEGSPDMLALPGERDNSSYKGTPFFLECQGMANASWEQLNPSSGANWEGKWKYTYNEAYTEHLKSAEEEWQTAITSNQQNNSGTEGANTVAAPTNDANSKQAQVTEAAKKLATAYNESFRLLAKAREEILKCHGMLGLSQRLGQGDYQEAKTWSPSTTKTSLDGQIKCKAMGAETQDYVPCTTAINAYDGLFVADQGVQVYQQVSYADKSMDIQQTMAENSTSVTAGLEAQKSNLEAQADLANQKAVFDGAKAAALAGAAGNMPSLSDLVGECKASLSRGGLNQINSTFNIISEHLMEQVKTKFGPQAEGHQVLITINPTQLTVKSIKEIPDSSEATHNPNAQAQSANSVTITAFTVGNTPNGQGGQDNNKSAENICNNVAGTEAQALIMNDEARQKMKAAMIAAGIDAAGNLAKAAILNKHADRIGDAIDDVESFAPPEFTGPAFEDGMFSECTADPESEACALEEANRRVDFSGNNISITGFERGVVGGTKNDGIAAMNDVDTSSSAARGGTSAPTIGSAIESVDKSSGLEDTVSKAGITTNPGGSGGGGGGGGPSGIAPPSGGGAQPLGSENQGANGIGGNTSKISFDGGTGRSTSLSGGTRAAAARKEVKVDNPFDKLFGKKGAGNELSFRNPAAIGKGKGSVLEQISRRYSEVSKTNRLHKYEEK